MLLKFRDDIKRAMKNGEVTLAVLADFSKAFDTVEYVSLMTTLHEMGFSNQFMMLLANYLTDRHQFVQIEDEISEQRCSL